MLTIAIMGSKGGVGKTTLALHSAIEADRIGLGPITIVDTDPQGSCVKWARRRMIRTGRISPAAISADPSTLMRSGLTLADVLNDLRLEGDQTVVIDTMPRHAASCAEIAHLCDVALIPCGPSILEIETVATTVALLRAAGTPAGIVLNQARPRSAVTQLAMEQLAEHGLPVCPTPITRRASLMDALSDGRSVHDAKPRDVFAQMEISLVFMWLLNLAKSANTSFAPMTATGMSDNHLWGNVDLKSDSLALQMR
jgi:chromosome partitioning protein